MLEKIPYEGKYPNASKRLLHDGVMQKPVQKIPSLEWADGIDVVYYFKDMTPAKFAEYEEDILLLAFQECERYKKDTKDVTNLMFFASFDVELGKLAKAKDLKDVVTFTAPMHDDPTILVYGPGYEVDKSLPLTDKLKQILNIAERYKNKVSKQKPYEVNCLRISIRDIFKKNTETPYMKEFKRLNPKMFEGEKK
jgi:hypothetical protein